QLGDIAAGTSVILVALAPRFNVFIKRWQSDHTDLAGSVPLLQRKDLFLGSLFIKADLVTNQSNDTMLAVGASINRQDVKPHDRPLVTTDHLNDLIETHTNYFLDRAFLALPDANNTVAHGKLAR